VLMVWVGWVVVCCVGVVDVGCVCGVLIVVLCLFVGVCGVGLLCLWCVCGCWFVVLSMLWCRCGVVMCLV
jgi:hypothetical protein